MNWDFNMEQILINVYPAYGINECIQALSLEDKDKSDVFKKVRNLNLKRNNKYLNEDDIEYLKNNYYIKSTDELIAHLNITKGSLYTIANKLGLNKGKTNNRLWTNNEIEYLKQNYESKSINDISIFLNRTSISVKCKLKKINENKRKYWTQEEIDILYKYFPTLDVIEISNKYLKNRTPEAIHTKSTKLKIKKIDSIGWDNSKKYIAIDNLTNCNSIYELKITNFLIDNDIPFKKEILYRNYSDDIRCGKKRCDWIIYDTIFVEFFGLMNDKRYSQKTKEKIDICKKSNIQLIQIYPSQINYLENIFNNLQNI